MPVEPAAEGLLRPELLRLLELAVLAVVLLSAALRPFSGGQPASEPETVFLDGLACFAALAWGAAKLASGDLPLLRWRPTAALGWFLAAVILAVLRALTDGCAQPALDLARAWLADLLTLVVVADLARRAPARRLLAAALLAGTATLAVYGLYQRAYGLPYFRQVLEARPQMVANTTGGRETNQRAFVRRVQSDRLPGPYGYPNAYAGYLLLFAPWLAAAAAGATGRPRQLLAAFVFTGSKAGLLTAKLLELIAIYILLQRRSRAPGFAWRAVLDAGLWLILLTGVDLLAAGLVGSLARLAGLATRAPGEVALALAWIAHLAWLIRRLANPATPEVSPRFFSLPQADFSSLQRRLGGGLILTGVLVGAAVLLLPPPPARSLVPPAGKIAKARYEAYLMFRVRRDYWRAAWGMLAQYPWRGVGLDNYASRYGQFRVPGGWPVKKVHNNYLQLAADGGLPLLGGFLALWLAVFGASRRAESALDAASPPPTERPALRLGWICGLSAFGLTYLLYRQGLFAGLSLEFFTLELAGRAEQGSLRAATGTSLPLLIHGGVHLLLLPLVWMAIFWAACRVEIERPAALTWLALGLVGLLIHTSFDFHYYCATLSRLALMGAGVFLGGREFFKPRALTPGASGIGLLAWLGGGWLVMMAWFVPQTNAAFTARLADLQGDVAAMAATPGERGQEAKKCAELAGEALSGRPYDSDLCRLQAKACLLQETPPGWSDRALSPLHPNYFAPTAKSPAELRQQALEWWRKGVELDPYGAEGWAALARQRLQLLPDGSDTRRTALADFRRASELNPLRPAYHLEIAELLAQSGQAAEAERQARRALELHRLFPDDENTLLNEEELARAKNLAQ